MKKTNRPKRPLRLETQTVRVLEALQLEQVPGGARGEVGPVSEDNRFEC